MCIRSHCLYSWQCVCVCVCVCVQFQCGGCRRGQRRGGHPGPLLPAHVATETAHAAVLPGREGLLHGPDPHTLRQHTNRWEGTLQYTPSHPHKQFDYTHTRTTQIETPPQTRARSRSRPPQDPREAELRHRSYSCTSPKGRQPRPRFTRDATISDLAEGQSPLNPFPSLPPQGYISVSGVCVHCVQCLWRVLGAFTSSVFCLFMSCVFCVGLGAPCPPPPSTRPLCKLLYVCPRWCVVPPKNLSPPGPLSL